MCAEPSREPFWSWPVILPLSRCFRCNSNLLKIHPSAPSSSSFSYASYFLAIRCLILALPVLRCWPWRLFSTLYEIRFDTPALENTFTFLKLYFYFVSLGQYYLKTTGLFNALKKSFTETLVTVFKFWQWNHHPCVLKNAQNAVAVYHSFLQATDTSISV